MSRRPHQPTEKQRQTIQMAKAAGLRNDQIAALIDIDVKTLSKHYAKELSAANAKAITAVAANLYKRAVSDEKEAVAAAIFWLKTRGGWRETDREEGPAQAITQVVIEVVGADKV